MRFIFLASALCATTSFAVPIAIPYLVDRDTLSLSLRDLGGNNHKRTRDAEANPHRRDWWKRDAEADPIYRPPHIGKREPEADPVYRPPHIGKRGPEAESVYRPPHIRKREAQLEVAK